MSGDPTDALALAQQGERLALARSEPVTAAWCQLHQARALASLGDSRSLSVARAAGRAFRAEACWVGAAQAHATVARRLVAVGADGVVEELAHAAVALDAVSLPSLAFAEAYADLAAAEAAIGMLERAAAHARLAVAIADDLDAPEPAALRLIAVLGDVVRQQVVDARRTDDEASARALARTWLAGWPRLEARARREPSVWPSLAVTAATLLVEVGDELVRALGLLDDLRQRAADRPEVVVAALGELARVNVCTGHLPAAHALLDDAERRALEARLHHALPGLAETRAAAYEAADDHASALRAFRRYHQHTVAQSDQVRRRQADAVRARAAELVQHSMVSALTDAANTDALTGLRNRRFLDTDAAALVDAGRERGEAACVAVIDVDKFKHVNDHFGHPIGDAVLVAVGQLLQGGVRDGDLVIRAGGDEFVLVLFGASMAVAHRALERVRASVEHADWAHRGLPAVTLTIGAAEVRTGEGLEDAIAEADVELLSAKRAGRNTVHSRADRAARP